MSKRGQNEGSWRLRPAGTWEYRFRVPGGEAGTTIRRSVNAATKAEALKKAEEIKRAAKRGVRATATRKVPTLDAWLDYWLRDVLPTSGRRTATRRSYEGLLRSHIVGKPIGKVRLTDLRPTKLSNIINSTRKENGDDLSPSSRRSLHAALDVALTDAVSDALIEYNPLDRVKRPARGRGGRAAEMRALTDEQVTELLEHTADHRHDAVVRTYLLTGMRRAEVLGLRWSDVDLDARTITVRQQLDDDSEAADVKTAAGERTLDIGDELADLLLAHGTAETVRLSALGHSRSDLVFTNKNGDAIGLRSFHRWYAPRAAAANADTGLHALRHTAISRWLMAGIPITVVAEWAGHSSAETTLRLYGWAIPRQTADYANRVQLSPHPSPHLVRTTA